MSTTISRPVHEAAIEPVARELARAVAEAVARAAVAARVHAIRTVRAHAIDAGRAARRRASGIARCTVLIVLALSATACATPPSLPTSAPDWSPAEPAPAPDTRDTNGAIWSSAGGLSLFEDVRARRVGDVVTVLLQERTAATKSASTNSSSTTSIDLPTPTVFGSPVVIGGREILSIDASAGTDFAGGGDAAQSNRLDGSIAVTIERVYPNGNLAIRGQKRISLNNGGEHVRVAGIVRAIDISPDNTVRSSDIADARIAYGGDGLVADASRAGWFTRMLNSSIWPF